MQKKPAPDFQQMLFWLITEVMYGRAHFLITRGLKRADPVVLDTAPRFFAMTLGAHADAALMNAARLFDRSPGVSIHTLLSTALRVAGTFKCGTSAEVRRVVAEAKTSVAALEPIVEALRTRRNETIAHLDPRTIVDPEGYVKAGRISFSELEGLFAQTGSILGKLSLLYRGTSVDLELKDAIDYEQALDLIADAKCDQARRYEVEHETPAPFPRPRKCRERSV